MTSSIESSGLMSLVGAAWVKTIVEDRRGQLWLGIDRGGVRISRASFQDALGTPQRVMTEGFELFDGLPGSIRAISDRVAARAFFAGRKANLAAAAAHILSTSGSRA